MKDAFGVSKAYDGCGCKTCKAQDIDCSKCPKCKGVSKGKYSNTIEGVQRDRMKANRRKAVGGALLTGSSIGAGAAIAMPSQTTNVVREGGRKIGHFGFKHYANGRAKYAAEDFAYDQKLRSQAGWRAMQAGTKIAVHPGKAVAGALVGTAIAGAGIKGAGMLHNARSNRNARKYNKGGHNSKIKIVPVSGKNRF